MDWEGPVPLDDDAESVQVQRLLEYLSSSEKDSLRQMLPHSESLSEEWMINCYSVAKVFIASTI